MWGVPRFGATRTRLKSTALLALALYRNTVQGIWNPSIMDRCDDALVSEAYKAHTEWRARAQHITIREIERMLGGKNLSCWCPLDSSCHADILLELANRA